MLEAAIECMYTLMDKTSMLPVKLVPVHLSVIDEQQGGVLQGYQRSRDKSFSAGCRGKAARESRRFPRLGRSVWGLTTSFVRNTRRANQLHVAA